jgi:SPP1 gp7 family putative phage head morphogenesis protein
MSFATYAKKYDPTGTMKIRSLYIRDIRKKFNLLKNQIKEKMRNWAESIRTYAEVDPFIFATDPAKLDLFMSWLTDMEEAGILYISHGPAQSIVGDSRWADIYIDSAYKKGVSDAYNRMGQGAKTGMESSAYIRSAFFGPIHADAIGLLFSRNFSELKGVTEQMNQRISRVLAQGLAEGRNPKKIATELISEVGWGRKRAEMVARTEITRAHAEGTLNSYASFGLQGVMVDVEWLSASDDRVCPHCSSMSGKVFTIEEARGLIPSHPNCRCCFIPVL